MRHAPIWFALVAACGNGNQAKKDAPAGGGDGGGSDAFVFDAPALIACAPQSGTNVAVRLIGQVSGGAVLATSPPNDGRLFVLEQAGRIRIFENEQLITKPFLDVSTLIAGGVPNNEQGLLGLAFHPNYGSNRELYIFYTTDNANIVARYHASATDPNVADTTGEIILSIPDFAPNHNGGMIEFGKDGYLYIGTGDGGGGGDPRRNGQAIDRTATSCTMSSCEPLLGKILRIDVNTTAGAKSYGIPSDNPFASGGGEPEIYIIGLRNPWRWSFDRENGDLYIGDVGQGPTGPALEEVTVLKAGDQAGKNLGWSMYEATGCYGNYTCSPTGKTMPQLVRSHGTDNWLAIIGGEVYRGNCFPDLKGTYFTTDFSAKQLTSAQLQANGTLTANALPTPTGGWPNGPSSLHGDARGELFMTTTNGSVYQIEAGP